MATATATRWGTADALADRLACSRSTAYAECARMAAAKAGCVLRVGAAWRVDVDAAESWLVEHAGDRCEPVSRQPLVPLPRKRVA